MNPEEIVAREFGSYVANTSIRVARLQAEVQTLKQRLSEAQQQMAMLPDATVEGEKE